MVYWLVRAANWLAGRVPRRARMGVAGTLAMLAYLCWPAKRRVTNANMGQVLSVPASDPRARKAARISWRNHGRYLSDFFYLSGRAAVARDEVRARTHDMTPPPGTGAALQAAQAHGKGVIIVTAHFGAWDVAGVTVANHTPLHVVVEQFSDPRMDALVQSQRQAMGMSVLWMEQSPRRILRVLKANGVVAIVTDRPMTSKDGVPVTFFGRRCYVPAGPATLALLSGAVILPGYARYDAAYSPAYYSAVLTPFFAESTGDRQADIIATTQRIYTALEEIIRPYPEQWAMFRPFWPAEREENTATIATAPDALLRAAGPSDATGPAGASIPMNAVRPRRADWPAAGAPRADTPPIEGYAEGAMTPGGGTDALHE